MAKRNRNIALTFRVNKEERIIIDEKKNLAGISNMRAYLLKMAVRLIKLKKKIKINRKNFYSNDISCIMNTKQTNEW